MQEKKFDLRREIAPFKLPLFQGRLLDRARLGIILLKSFLLSLLSLNVRINSPEEDTRTRTHREREKDKAEDVKRARAFETRRQRQRRS